MFPSRGIWKSPWTKCRTYHPWPQFQSPHGVSAFHPLFDANALRTKSKIPDMGRTAGNGWYISWCHPVIYWLGRVHVLHFRDQQVRWFNQPVVPFKVNQCQLSFSCVLQGNGLALFHHAASLPNKHSVSQISHRNRHSWAQSTITHPPTHGKPKWTHTQTPSNVMDIYTLSIWT